MPSTYTPPDVIVTQVRRTALANTYLPQLPVCVVGPSRQIVVREPAGTYEAGFEFTAPIPKLIEGAILDQDTVKVTLEASNLSAKQLGFFDIDSIDYTISDDGTQLAISDDISLEYSLLSKRNNTGALVSNDVGSAQTDGILFTDKQVDFVSRGATKNGDSYIIVTSPANQIGRYRIYDLVPNGTKVNAVKAELVDANDDPVLTKTFTLLTAAQPPDRFVYGYPATHELTGHTLNASGFGSGIGIKSRVLDLAITSEIAALFHAAINIPDADSGDAVVFAPDPSGSPANTGNATPEWILLIGAAKVGNYLRIHLATPAIRDFRITAIDTVARSLTLQNDDFTGTGTQILAAGGAGVTSIECFEVLKGSDDSTTSSNGAGDVVVGEADGIPFEVEIKRATPGFLELEETLPSYATDTVVAVRRGVPFNSDVTAYDLTKKISTGFTATVLVSYQAQRQDLPLRGLIELSDQKSIEQNLGMIHPDNPIALMSNMVARSGLTNPTQTFYALVTADETLASYEDALSVLERADVYFIVPATQEKAILDLYRNHVEDQSQPVNKHERVCLGSTAIITSELNIPPLPTTNFSTGNADSLTPRVFHSTLVDWTQANPGDVLSLMSAANPDTATVLASYRIESVDVPGKSVTLLSDIDSSYVGVDPDLNPQFFKVNSYPYDSNAQAEAWRDESSSYKSFRFMMVRPDSCELTYTDKTQSVNTDTEIIVPTFYLAALFAGMKASLPPEQPMTNVPVPGITRLFHSNQYFTPAQLNTIAEGGNAIFTQKTRESAPMCRHQLMTDMTSLYTREFSIIVLVDFAAKYLRNSYEPYIGNHVISAEYLTQLRGIGESLIRRLVTIGCLLRGTTLDKLYQDPDAPDEIIVDITLQIPIPCNKIKITLYL